MDQHLLSKEGLKLVTRSWLVSDAVANVFLIHGYAEHSGRYQYESEFLNRQGFNVYAIDLRGHGRSEGERAYVNRFSDYLDDFQIFLDAIVEKIEEAPSFIFAHSMGGLITVSYLIEKNIDHQNFKGLMLSAPALKIHSDISPFLQKISGLISAIAPRLQTVPLDNTTLSHDPNIFIEHEKDPLNYKGKTKARMGGEMIKQMKSIRNKFSSFQYPLLAMHGTDDKHAEITGTKTFFEAARSEDKELFELDGFYHEITKEVEKDKVLNKMVEWMKARI